MVHVLQIVIQLDRKEYKFEGRSTHGAALVVSFREWLASVPFVEAKAADELDMEVVWNGVKDRKGEVPSLSSDLLPSTLSPEHMNK